MRRGQFMGEFWVPLTHRPDSFSPVLNRLWIPSKQLCRLPLLTNWSCYLRRNPLPPWFQWLKQHTFFFFFFLLCSVEVGAGVGHVEEGHQNHVWKICKRFWNELEINGCVCCLVPPCGWPSHFLVFELFYISESCGKLIRIQMLLIHWNASEFCLVAMQLMNAGRMDYFCVYL